MIDPVIEKFKLLKLKACAENLSQVVELATKQNLSALHIIEHLVDLELESREKNRIALRFKQSKLFEKPTIDQFDCNFHVCRKKQKSRILNLMDLEFIKQKRVRLLGSDQATMLIYHDKHSKNRSLEPLNGHFQGKNHHSKEVPPTSPQSS